MSVKKNTPILLAILDGLACNPNSDFNAVKAASTPVLDDLISHNPYTQLITYGEKVGLPDGQMGNSEVGHLHIGGGRIIEQDLTRINKTSINNSFDKIEAFNKIQKTSSESPDSCLHLIGLTSKGGVHSELSHLLSILTSAAKSNIKNIRVHCITDGRDRPQKAAMKELSELDSHIKKLTKEYPDSNILIASVIGRYYAMDRDKRWERTKKAYDLFTNAKGKKADSVSEILENSYSNGITDEFIEPHILNCPSDSRTTIRPEDCLLFFNFRADRMKQIITSFFQQEFDGFQRDKTFNSISITTLSQYDSTFPCNVLFPPVEIKNHLGEYLANNSYSQLRIAETEKYPHVTYFFNGGNENELEMEERILVPSPRDVPTYDKKPEMSAVELTDKLIERLSADNVPDVIILNYANCDMVGHTGNYEATIKAVETVDSCLGRVLNKIDELQGIALITADHGNADQMIDYDTQEQHTYHTTHPVPFIIYDSQKKYNFKLEEGGALPDIAPTIIEILGLKKPSEMTGKSLIIEQ